MAKATKCPLCGEPSSQESRPFCSRRCKDRDLINWLDGGYAVLGREDDDSGLDIDGDPRL